jgi:ketosteroid isomerase-like protein
MRIWITTICSAFLITTGACSEPSNRGLSAEDRAGLEAMTQSWLAAHRDRDWDAPASHYTENAILMPPFAPIIQGKSTIRDWFAENEVPTTIEVENIEIEGYEDLAYVRGTSIVTREIPGNSPVSFEGKFLDIRRRDVDGSWKVSIDMFSPDLPLD